ncbi:GH25 family lysozyme [Bythopirellula polymerisocia]|uniref:GH25 family lysozyme n=1 Tax=Bythopirellula polymerisocia TaxID=2528003 RepID=UPI0018D2B35D|nr:GH25 family lysozyme [Bythopirellula polymerisocia]
MFDLTRNNRHFFNGIAFIATVFVQLSFSNLLATAQVRSLGLDVSAWQGNLSTNTWNALHNTNDRDFVFIRSSRGGTTGFYNQSDPNNNNNQNTLSQRYDDPYFVQNITRATAAGMFAGPYHFARPDIISSTQNSGGIANTGTDEANHFLQMAGAWMRPGYLLPVFDLEAGQSQRTASQLTQFSIDFSNRIQEVTGVRPQMYINGNYASYVQSSIVNAFPDLWIARWPNQSNPNSIPVQTANPNDSLSWLYGPWDNFGDPQPWAFWQYASTARLSGFNNGNSNLDVNVANGGIEFVKDKLVPALWTNDSDGQWTSLTNWNSGQTPVAPVQGPGQVARVGALTLPSVRLPGANDTVILDRPNASIDVTLSSGTHNIRKLFVRESLNMTGGSLNVGYVPSSDSTPVSAQFSAPVSITGNASLSAHTLLIDPFQTLTLAGASLSFERMELMPHGTAPAMIAVLGDVSFNPLTSGGGTIANVATPGLSSQIDLGGENRVFNIADGAANVDLSIEVPISNGSLTKTGLGTLSLSGINSFSGDAVVQQGVLSINIPSLADDANVSLSTGGILDLNFSGPPDMVSKLSIDGTTLPIGTWGSVGSGAQFTTPLITGTGLLEVTSTVSPGDFDGDGDVDGNDLTEWQAAYGNTAGADADQDGDSDGQDFLTWQRNYTGSNLLTTATAVPEPSAICLIGFALALMAGFRRS